MRLPVASVTCQRDRLLLLPGALPILPDLVTWLPGWEAAECPSIHQLAATIHPIRLGALSPALKLP